MGSKSSFAVASLAHHALIQYCIDRLPTELKPSIHTLAYAIVGDDLVIFHEPLVLAVRKAYGVLGVQIQESKSKIPVGEEF